MRRYAKWCACLLLVYVFAPCADARLLLHAGGATALAATVTWLNVKDYGAICDGSAHALSTRYGSLGAAQAVYPFVTSLTQQIDYAALQLTSNTAFGAAGSEHGTTHPELNVPVYIPHGICILGSDIWTIRNLDGGQIIGDGPQATQIQGSGNAVLAFDGLWYSHLKDFEVYQTNAASTTALDVDGNTGTAGYSTIGVQADTFDNIVAYGGGANYAVAVCRQGGGGGQCSEMTWGNFHGSNASSAVFYQTGGNAIDNVLVGGDMQNFPKNGVWVIGGSIQLLKVSFESTTGYNQVANGGCDVQVAGGGGSISIDLIGVRSESWCVYHADNSTELANLTGVHQSIGSGLYSWSANYSGFALNAAVRETGTDGLPHMYRVTTTGTTGSSPPTWPASGTVNDGGAGGVTWTETEWESVHYSLGQLNHKTSEFDMSSTIKENYLYVPQLNNCGTSPTVDSQSTSWNGSLTEGGSATGCKVVLPQVQAPNNNPPHCVVSSPNNATITSYAVDLNGVFNSSPGFFEIVIVNPSASPAPQFSWNCY